MTEIDQITSFTEKFRFLSNFYSCKIIFDEKEYSSTEHAYQASKTLDKTEREKIRLVKTPGEAKN